MKAADHLTDLRDVAQSISEADNTDVQRQNYGFCARLCEELHKIINTDAVLNEAQAEFVSLTVGNIGQKFLPGHDVQYMETPTMCPFLLMQLAAYINSCK